MILGQDVDNEVFDAHNGKNTSGTNRRLTNLEDSISSSSTMIRYEIEYYENVKKQTKLLESIAKSLEIIANEYERKRKEKY